MGVTCKVGTAIPRAWAPCILSGDENKSSIVTCLNLSCLGEPRPQNVARKQVQEKTLLCPAFPLGLGRCPVMDLAKF